AHVARLEEEADRLAEREVAANAALVAARDRLEAERALAEGVERRARLRAEQERLDRAEDEVAQDRRRVDAAARAAVVAPAAQGLRSEEHTSELQSRENLVCRLLLEKKKQQQYTRHGRARPHTAR